MTLIPFLYFYLILVGFYYLFYGSFLLINNVKTLRLLLAEKNKQLEDNKKENGDDKYKVNFILLVPVLREEKIIAQTLSYLSQLNNKFLGLKIIIITTQRELIERSNNQKENTIDIVKKLIPLLNQKLNKKLFFHFHYPFLEGGKSGQLNFALKNLESEDSSIFKGPTTYIGLYDADSISDLNILQLLARDSIRNDFPLVYQQPVIYLKNYNSLPYTINGCLMKSFALLQTRYALGYEVPMFLDSQRNVQRRVGKMAYCLGHGLFVRADFLKKLNFFPSPIEDTRFGHILSYLKYPIKLLPSLAVTEVVPKFLWFLKQSSVWYIGESYFLEDYKIAKKIQKIEKMWALSLIFYKFYRNFIWATEGVLLGSAILIGLYLPQKIFLLPLLIGLFVYIYLCPYYLLISSKKLLFLCNYKIKFHPNKRDYLLNLLFLPIVSLLSCLGPLWGGIRFVVSQFANKPILFPKTPR
jgi:hypothetical protein